MKETGIVMSGNHPRLILDGGKTMTRRTYGLEFVNQDPDAVEFLRMEGDLAVFHKLRNFIWPSLIIPPQSSPKRIEGADPNLLFYIKCPYGQVGDRLWARETWRPYSEKEVRIEYKADGTIIDYPEQHLFTFYGCGQNWHPSIHIPKKFARIWLEITGLRAERLGDISDSDCQSEGCQYPQWQGSHTSWKGAYNALWDSLNALKYPWSGNWWVWVIDFKGIG